MRPLIDFSNSVFLETGVTGAIVNRLNWRCELLLTRNQERIRGKRVLDIACHDGRLSWACLQLGAEHVTGVEGNALLVERAEQNLSSYGIPPGRFRFIVSDIFDFLPQCDVREFDLILCCGFFYHTIRQVELIRELDRIRPTWVMLDTEVAPDRRPILTAVAGLAEEPPVDSSMALAFL